MFLNSLSMDVQSWLVRSTILMYVLTNEDPDPIVDKKRRTQKNYRIVDEHFKKK